MTDMTNPRKLYIEITTRCNLRCEKCVKQVENSQILEGDMDLELFQRLVPDFADLDMLVLNGIGEPLLHPNLEHMIGLARQNMPKDGEIGFQSNGLLMTREKADGLVRNGLSTVCFSLDSLQSNASLTSCSGAPDITTVSLALNNLHQATDRVDAKFRLGLEVVIHKGNIAELPSLVKWAGKHYADYILISHLFAYDRDMAAQSLFSPNTSEALSFLQGWENEAESMGINLQDGLNAHLKFLKTPAETQAMSLLSKMCKEARGRDLDLHLSNLFQYNERETERTRTIFKEADAIARQKNISLELPPLLAQSQRSCPFIEAEAAFISISGEVMPCHFLWHSYPCMAGNDNIEVQQRSFGNIRDSRLGDIWQNHEFHQFRKEADNDSYSQCWSCPQGPCADMVNTNLTGVHDCHGSLIPCGHCRWSIGGLRCL